MYPILWQWGQIIIPAWHTFVALGAIAGFYLSVYFLQKLSPEIQLFDIKMIYILVYLGGYFGARLLSIFVEEINVQGASEIFAALFKLGPMTFYGGGISAFFLGLVYCLVKRLPALDIMDVGIPAGLIGLGLGRIGCFLNGDDFGIPVPLASGESAPWWAVTIPVLNDNTPRYPVQLIEAWFCLTLGALIFIAFLNRINRASADEKIRFWPPGIIGLFTVLAYALQRFLNEYLRGDFRGNVFTQNLSTSQTISLLLIVVSAAIGYATIHRARRRGNA